MSSDSNRVSRRFSTSVGGGSSGELTHEVKKDATIEKVDVRFYRGPRLDLEVRPFIEPTEGDRIDLVDLIGRNVIVGDDDRFTFFVSDAVEEGDVIGVEYNNTDGSHIYDFVVDMELDRAAGVDRLVDRLATAVRGVV